MRLTPGSRSRSVAILAGLHAQPHRSSHLLRLAYLTSRTMRTTRQRRNIQSLSMQVYSALLMRVFRRCVACKHRTSSSSRQRSRTLHHRLPRAVIPLRHTIPWRLKSLRCKCLRSTGLHTGQPSVPCTQAESSSRVPRICALLMRSCLRRRSMCGSHMQLGHSCARTAPSASRATVSHGARRCIEGA